MIFVVLWGLKRHVQSTNFRSKLCILVLDEVRAAWFVLAFVRETTHIVTGGNLLFSINKIVNLLFLRELNTGIILL